MDISILTPDGSTRLGTIVADCLATAERLNPGLLCVERGTGADLTATWAPSPGAPLQRNITPEQFRDRFTAAELAGITSLAYSGTGDATVQIMLLKATSATEGIDLGSAEVISGLDYLVSKGKLTAARKAEVLA